MKSKLTTCHAWVRTGNGCRRPGVLMCSVLACWHVWHCCTNCCTISFRLVHANNALTLLYVALIPEWPPMLLSCTASKMCCWANELLPIQTRPLNLITPSCNVYPFVLLPVRVSSVSNCLSSGSSKYPSCSFWIQVGKHSEMAATSPCDSYLNRASTAAC